MRELPSGTVTLLFTDIEGSTALLEQLGERYSIVLTEYRHLVRAACSQWNGYEVDTQGDAFFVAFARASNAVNAAVQMQRAISVYAWPDGVSMRVRMGLHTGEPQLSALGYVGLDVHRAARIMSAGHGGQVLLSQTTCDLVEQDLPDGVSLWDLGTHRLKDLQQKSPLFQLVISGLPATFPPLRTLDTHPNNLPIQPTPLIGRTQEMAGVAALLVREDIRLVSLTGPGGTGKTRLGLQVAAEQSEMFPDGVFFVNLAPLSDPEFVLAAIAQVLDVKETGEQSVLDLLKAYIREKCMLLLLDNFEQVVSAASHVAELLAACPKLKILVTSRMALRVQAEYEFAVPPLKLPDPKRLPDLVTLSQYEAVALFIQRAQAVKSDFQVTNATAPAVAEICVRLDGLPLALELAAARIKLLPPHALLSRLSQRLTFLTSGARDVPARQQTLRKTIDWSYHLLDAQEQQLFRRLCVFVGGCTLEAVEAVYTTLGDDKAAGWVLDGIASLIDKSLVRQIAQEGEEPCLVILETIREYGLEALTASGEMGAMQHAHATYYLTLAEEAEAEVGGSQQDTWLERLERDHDNLRAALSWALEQEPSGEVAYRQELALRLGGALRQFWISAHLGEGLTFLERAIATSAGAAPALRAKALMAAGDVALVDDTQRGEALAEEALLLCQKLEDRAGIAFCLYQLGFFATTKGQYTRARSLLEESAALFRAVGNKNRLGWTLYALGRLDIRQEEYAKALAHYEEALALFRELGNKQGIAEMLTLAASVLFYSEGDVATARLMGNEGLQLARETANKWLVVLSLRVCAEIGLFGQDDIATARSLAEEALGFSREAGIIEFIEDSLSLIAWVEARQRNYSAVQSLYEEILTLASETNDAHLIPFYLYRLAEVVAAQGEAAWAARLWGAAESLREANSSPLILISRAGYERAVAAARSQLGEQAFSAAWSEGRTMRLEQVLAVPSRATLSPPPLTEHPATTTAKTMTTSLAGLTAKEVEIMRLVAQGLTDAQVAEQLVISPRTVNWHLTSIYSKLQVSSHAAATRYAIEHHLV